jgi:hypothetical protein
LKFADSHDSFPDHERLFSVTPSRTATDLSDIQSLMELHGEKLDWARIDEYFNLFEMESLAAELKDKYRAAG